MFFKRTPSISTHELQNMLESSPQIIDVREPFEYSAGHIPGAKNVPIGTVNHYTPKGKTYVICQSGGRSARATAELLSKGFDVVNVSGGMMSWNGPVSQGK